MKTWQWLWCLSGKPTVYHQDWWHPGCLLSSTVPDTQPGLHPGVQKRGWRGLTSSAAFPFAWLCPLCQVLVPWELTPLLTAFVGWFGCGHLVLKAVPLCATCNPWGCCGCSLGSGKRSRMRLSLQGCSSALPTGELCQSPWRASCCFCAGYRFPAHGTCHCLALQKELRGLQPACSSQRGFWCVACTGCVQAEHCCMPGAAGMRLLLPQQQQAGLLLGPALNLAGSEELIARGVVLQHFLTSHLTTSGSQQCFVLSSHFHLPSCRLQGDCTSPTEV